MLLCFILPSRWISHFPKVSLLCMVPIYLSLFSVAVILSRHKQFRGESVCFNSLLRVIVHCSGEITPAGVWGKYTLDIEDSKTHDSQGLLLHKQMVSSLNNASAQVPCLKASKIIWDCLKRAAEKHARYWLYILPIDTAQTRKQKSLLFTSYCKITCVGYTICAHDLEVITLERS